MNSRILVIEDDRFLSESLARLLGAHNYDVVRAFTGTDGLREVASTLPDLVVLDLNLPDKDGVVVCRHLRTHYRFPIIMLTSRNESIDKVIGLEAGADDYIVKPFDGHELVARVRAHLRRAAQYGEPALPSQSFGNVSLERATHSILVDNKPLELTETEYRLFEHLAAQNGGAISRERLFESVWGFEIDFSSNTLDVLIYRLRTKLAAAGAPPLIHTLRGFGFKLGLEP